MNRALTILLPIWVLGTPLKAQCPPVIVEQPVSGEACIGFRAEFAVRAVGDGVLTYQWWMERDMVLLPVVDGGHISGAGMPMLTISPLSLAESQAAYWCEVSSACGTSASIRAQRIIGCIATFDDGSGSNCPQGCNDCSIDDLLYFLAYFELGDSLADVDDGTWTAMPDGGITIDDLLYFLIRYEEGC